MGEVRTKARMMKGKDGGGGDVYMSAKGRNESCGGGVKECDIAGRHAK